MTIPCHLNYLPNLPFKHATPKTWFISASSTKKDKRLLVEPSSTFNQPNLSPVCSPWSGQHCRCIAKLPWQKEFQHFVPLSESKEKEAPHDRTSFAFLWVGTICILLLPVVCCFFSVLQNCLARKCCFFEREEKKRKTQDWIDQTNIRRHTAPNDFWGIHKKNRETEKDWTKPGKWEGKSQKTHQAKGKEKHVTHRLRCFFSRMSKTMNGYGSRLDGSEIEGQVVRFFTLAMSCRRWLVVNLFCSLHCLAFCLCEFLAGTWKHVVYASKICYQTFSPTFYLLSLPFHAIFCSRPHRRQPPQEF